MIRKNSIKAFILSIILTSIFSCQSDDNGRTMLRIGNKQYNKKQYNDSESSYLKSIEKSKSAEALYGRGNSSQRLSTSLPSDKLSKMDSVSLASYQSALEESGPNTIKKSKIYHNMGNSCYLSGLRNKKMQRLDESNKKFSEAVDYYKSSLRLNPKDDETRYNLSLALYMLEKNQEEQKNQDQNQNENKDNQDKQQNQDKDKQDQDKDKDNQNQDKDKQNQDKDKQNQDKDKKDQDKKDQQKSEESDSEQKDKNKDYSQNEKEPNQKENQDKKEEKNESKDNSQNQNNKTPDSSSSPTKPDKIQGKIDKKTANQLLNAAQQDENKVQKKIEKAIGAGGSYEKDW